MLPDQRAGGGATENAGTGDRRLMLRQDSNRRDKRPSPEARRHRCNRGHMRVPPAGGHTAQAALASETFMSDGRSDIVVQLGQALQAVGMARQTLRGKVEGRIAASPSDVFLPREFNDLGGQDQILRALRELVRDHRLVKIGHGIYARCFTSKLTGKVVLYSEGGFIGAARQALDKLGVLWELTEAQLAYNEGRSTQVPVNPIVRVKGRFSRRLKFGKLELRVER